MIVYCESCCADSGARSRRFGMNSVHLYKIKALDFASTRQRRIRDIH